VPQLPGVQVTHDGAWKPVPQKPSHELTCHSDQKDKPTRHYSTVKIRPQKEHKGKPPEMGFLLDLE